MDTAGEPTSRSIFTALLRSLWLIVVAAAGTGVVVYLGLDRQVPVYEANATVIASTQGPDQFSFGTTLVAAPQLAISTYRTVATSRTIAIAALTAIEGWEPSDTVVRSLQRATSVQIEDGFASAILRYSVRDPSSERARDLADALARALVAWDVARASDYLEASIAVIEAQLATLDADIAAASGEELDALQGARAALSQSLASTRALRSATVGRLYVFERAALPTVSVIPRPLRDALLAAFAVTFVLLGYVLIREGTSRRFRTLEDVARYTGLQVLATFPRRRGQVPALGPASYLGAMLTSVPAKGCLVVLVASPHPSEGSTDVSIALAEAFTGSGLRTLLFDADARQRGVATYYGLVRKAQWTPFPGRSHTARTPVTVANLDVDTLWDRTLTTAVPGLGSGEVERILEARDAGYEAIVIDGPPILDVADTLVVAPHATATVIATSWLGHDPRGLKRALGLLRHLGVLPIGVVVTNVPGERAPDAGFGLGMTPNVTPQPTQQP